MTSDFQQITVEIPSTLAEALLRQAAAEDMTLEQFVASMAVHAAQAPVGYYRDVELLGLQHQVHSRVFQIQRHHHGHAKKWLMSHHDQLGDIPWIMMESKQGAERVIEHLNDLSAD